MRRPTAVVAAFLAFVAPCLRGETNRLGYHAAVRKDDRDFLAKIDAAVRDLASSGEIATIRTKWEGP
jgi:ABC-type amino acid transport substrate-binding protein